MPKCRSSGKSLKRLKSLVDKSSLKKKKCVHIQAEEHDMDTSEWEIRENCQRVLRVTRIGICSEVQLGATAGCLKSTADT